LQPIRQRSRRYSPGPERKSGAEALTGWRETLLKDAYLAFLAQS